MYVYIVYREAEVNCTLPLNSPCFNMFKYHMARIIPSAINIILEYCTNDALLLNLRRTHHTANRSEE